MRKPWFTRPYVSRIHLVGALAMSVFTEAFLLMVFVEARKFHPSLDSRLYVLAFSIIALTLVLGAVQGFRVMRRTRSTFDAGNDNAALILVTRQYLLTIAMANLGCVAMIISIIFLIGLLTPK